MMDLMVPYFEVYNLEKLESYYVNFKRELDESKKQILLEDYVTVHNNFADRISRLQDKFFAYTCKIKRLTDSFLPSSLWGIKEMLAISFPRLHPENLDTQEFKDEDLSQTSDES